jgi:hypothetical protein
MQKIDSMVERIKPKKKNGKIIIKESIMVDARDVRKQKIVLGITCSAIPVVAGLSAAAYSLPVFQNNPTLSLIPLATGIIAVDTGVRMAKSLVKSASVPDYMPPPEPTCLSRSAQVAGTVGLLVLIGGISAFVGPKMISAASVISASSNPGFAVVAAQEVGAWVKVVTNKIVPNGVALIGTLGLIAAGTGVYIARDLIGIVRETPGYGAGLFMGTTLVGLACYLAKSYLRNDKLPVELEMREV